MLTPEEIDEITSLAGRYAEKRAASVEALRLVQRSHGWVSNEDLREVARILEISADELDGVATFYNLIFRRPAGRHVILLCDSVSCWIMGYEAVLDRLQATLGITLGGTTADGRFTLLPVVCLGACDRAPAMMVDENLHSNLDPGELGRLLAQYR